MRKLYISPNKFISYDVIMNKIQNNEDEIILFDHDFYDFLEHEFKNNTLDIKGKNILDLGCNIGSYCFLSEKYGANATGVELNSDLFDISNIIKEKIKSNVEFINTDMSEFNMKNKYDIAYLFNDPLDRSNPIKIRSNLVIRLLMSNIKYIYLTVDLRSEYEPDYDLHKLLSTLYTKTNYIKQIYNDLLFVIYKKKGLKN